MDEEPAAWAADTDASGGPDAVGRPIPFRRAARLIGHFRNVEVSEATVRRATEKSGHLELQTKEVAALEGELQEAPEPALQQLSVDGAMVPLLHGEWGEVKTLAIGVIEEPAAPGEVHAREMSYFSRMTDHQSFARLHGGNPPAGCGKGRKGMCGGGRSGVAAEVHRPAPARRGVILDWCHGAEYLARASQAAFGSGTAQASDWLGRQLHELKHGEPEGLLENLRGLCRELGDSGEGDAHFKPSGVFGEAPGPDKVCSVPGARLSHRQWGGGERQQARGGGPAQGLRDALGQGACRPYVGAAHGGLQ